MGSTDHEARHGKLPGRGRRPLRRVPADTRRSGAGCVPDCAEHNRIPAKKNYTPSPLHKYPLAQATICVCVCVCLRVGMCVESCHNRQKGCWRNGKG